MDVAKKLLMRAFGRPEGLLGRLGGTIMGRMNRPAAAWGVKLLELRGDERVLEIGFGPGVAIELLADAAPGIRIAGIDPSDEMLRQAAKRNAAAIARQAVDLRRGSADHLPFADASFGAALAVNSMQVWPNALAGLREIHRVGRAGARLVLVFTPRSGQVRDGIRELLSEAGFVEALLVEGEPGFAALARRP